MSEIRLLRQDDIPHIRVVLQSIDLFPADALDGMVANFLTDASSSDVWFCATDEQTGTPIGFAYCATERATEGTVVNVLAIGVSKDSQSRGVGTKLIAHIEGAMKERGVRVLIIETSSADEYAKSRRLYEHLGFAQEAVIRDFWKDGDHKVVFWKKVQVDKADT